MEQESSILDRLTIHIMVNDPKPYSNKLTRSSKRWELRRFIILSLVQEREVRVKINKFDTQPLNKTAKTSHRNNNISRIYKIEVHLIPLKERKGQKVR